MNHAELHETAHAKLTLYLQLLGRRESDGYHLLDALVVFTEFGDHLSAREAGELSLRVQGPFAVPTGAENLILQAAALMQQRFGVSRGAALTLDKHIPVAAGLGGGSADAAAALRLLNRLWRIDAPLDALAPLAVSLGCDVLACLHQQPLRMQGVGERVCLLDETQKDAIGDGALLLVNPRQPLLTADVYAACKVPSEQREATAFVPHWPQAGNDMQRAASRCLPLVHDVLTQLEAQQGCDVARLCGSGATCFGWFADARRVQDAACAIRSARPDWWLMQTSLLRSG